MRESELFPPVRKWLESRGAVVYVEHFDADVIGILDGRLIVVELKTCFSRGLFDQLQQRARWADEVWAAIPTFDSTKKYGGLRSFGFGLLDVRDGKLRQRIKAKPQPFNWHKMRAYRSKKLLSLPCAGPNDLAGLPACTALREQRIAAGIISRVF